MNWIGAIVTIILIILLVVVILAIWYDVLPDPQAAMQCFKLGYEGGRYIRSNLFCYDAVKQIYIHVYP